jgi:hypothetical protein
MRKRRPGNQEYCDIKRSKQEPIGALDGKNRHLLLRHGFELGGVLRKSRPECSRSERGGFLVLTTHGSPPLPFKHIAVNPHRLMQRAARLSHAPAQAAHPNIISADFRPVRAAGVFSIRATNSGKAPEGSKHALAAL